MPHDAAAFMYLPNSFGAHLMWNSLPGRPATVATASTQVRPETRTAIGLAAPDPREHRAARRQGAAPSPGARKPTLDHWPRGV